MRMLNKAWKPTDKEDEAVAAEGSPRHTSMLCVPSPAPAPTGGVGVVAFIAPDGTTVVRFSAWRRVVQHAQCLRQQGASFAEVATYLTRKANELEAKWGWLKRLWAARLQRVLRRLALQQGLLRRWDGKDDDFTLPETLYLFAASPVSPKECRAPPDDLDASLKPSPSWLSPSIPRSLRAPNCAALWWCVGGCVVLHAA
ncbi:MAG: hypothetical protein YPKNTGVA_001484 [Candidatus Fervidibacter sp.]